MKVLYLCHLGWVSLMPTVMSLPPFLCPPPTCYTLSPGLPPSTMFYSLPRSPPTEPSSSSHRVPFLLSWPLPGTWVFIPTWLECCSVSQAGPELMIRLLQSLECWEPRLVPTHLAVSVKGEEIRPDRRAHIIIPGTLKTVLVAGRHLQ